jgi:WD40 repeat protein
VAISTNNTIIVSASNDNCINIWNSRTGQLLSSLAGNDSCIASVEISSNNLKIVSRDHNGTIKIWDARHGNY